MHAGLMHATQGVVSQPACRISCSIHGAVQGFQVGAATESTDSPRRMEARTRPSRLRPRRSAAGAAAVTHRGASQNTQRKPLDMPP